MHLHELPGTSARGQKNKFAAGAAGGNKNIII